jgi:alpha-N-acetylglucosaminidase
MLQAKDKNRDSYRHDLVNVASQTLANYALVLNNAMISDYNAHDIKAFDKSSSEFLGVIADIDGFAATRNERLIGKWIKDAKSFGADETQRRYYEQNARTILTTWGEKGKLLNDYANRNWAGLIKGYYLERWQLFVKDLKVSLNSKTAFDAAAFHEKITDFEWNWTLSNEEYSSKPVGDSLGIADELYTKYAAKISRSSRR